MGSGGRAQFEIDEDQPMWRCPNCKTAHESGRYPDHWATDGGSNLFEFECPCGATFDVEVDWQPYFRVITKSMTVKAPVED